MEILKNKKFVILDGAMGTMLQKSGLKIGQKPEMLAFENEAAVYSVHRLYIEAGSDVIYANTFGANELKLKGVGKSVDEIIKKNVAVAKKAAEGTDVLVALDIGPLGEMLEPNGGLSFESAYEYFKTQAISGEAAGCDMAVIETMTDLYELKAAVLAVRENTRLPVLATMSFEKNGRTFSGCSAENAAITLTGLGVDAIGINCSLGPDEIFPIAKKMSEFTQLPLVIKANAGLPDPATGEYDISASEFAGSMAKFSEIGARFVGGCCGTSPEYIKELRKQFDKLECRNVEKFTGSVICSASKTCVIDKVKVIGERINPTGKKVFREALKQGDLEYVFNAAVSQSEAGAEILDVNVGVPGIDEPYMMAKCVKAVQSVSDCPLQIDSTMPEAIEAGLRVCNGKAIVNSVNGEDKVLHSILPIVKKYGASVVGLTLDENGIPKKWEDRVKIAEKILKTAESYGIKREDVFIDALTLTASTEQEAVYETLKTVRYVSEKLGLKTVLGVSNISFGLPERRVVNSTFLTLAMEYGLNLPIINPEDKIMMGAVYAFGALSGSDKGCGVYTEKMSDAKEEISAQKDEISLEDAVLKGLRSEAGRICTELLKEHEELKLVNEYLIPALDKAGEKYEKGVFFLPQLLGAANAASGAFEAIKESLGKKGSTDCKKGRIILATVKGDIHDIGKNIVKVILENYGYDVIDLGKDVKPETVVERAKAEGVKLVGLSALMTTTLKSMEETVRLLKAECPEAVVMCGGAVLTESYVKSIGGDFYAKDAKQSADIAKRVLG